MEGLVMRTRGSGMKGGPGSAAVNVRSGERQGLFRAARAGRTARPPPPAGGHARSCGWMRIRLFTRKPRGPSVEAKFPDGKKPVLVRGHANSQRRSGEGRRTVRTCWRTRRSTHRRPRRSCTRASRSSFARSWSRRWRRVPRSRRATRPTSSRSSTKGLKAATRSESELRCLVAGLTTMAVATAEGPAER
jgi:hypothetical protein